MVSFYQHFGFLSIKACLFGLFFENVQAIFDHYNGAMEKIFGMIVCQYNMKLSVK